MKTFASLAHIGGHDAAACWTVRPDSCWLLSRRPLFVPDFDGGVLAYPSLALKTGRLGKCIAHRFASRYFAAFAPALMLMPRIAIDMISHGVTPPAPLLCFDNSIVLGDWQNFPISAADAAQAPHHYPDYSLPAAMTVRYINPDGAVTESAAGIPEEAPLSLLAAVSESMTVKTGDIALVPLDSPPFEAIEGASIEILAGPSRNPQSLLLTHFK